MRTSAKPWVLPIAAMTAIATLATAGAATAGPLGNNGTVKIDGIPFDIHPNNEPHVGCDFDVDFYGYEEGDLNARVRFHAQPPTGKKILLLNDYPIDIGEDPAGGGTDHDASRVYNLTDALQTYMGHPNQGYHVKLTVNAPGSIGKDTKYKTFWVTGCAGY